MNAAHERIVVLIDGSNVERCRRWQRLSGEHIDADERRMRLVDAVAGWAALCDVSVMMTFDGAGYPKPGTDRLELVASGARSADELLEARAVELRRGVAGDGHVARAYWVVTNDRQVQQVAGRGAERVIGADDFVMMIEAGSTHIATASSDGDETMPASSQLAARLDEHTRARLERLRRR